MKISIFLLVLFIFFLGAGTRVQAQAPVHCSQFQTGEFRYVAQNGDTVRIKRSKGKQEERSEQTGVVTKFKLRWTDSCTYELRQIWSNSKARRKSNKSVTRVVITAVYPNRYDYRCDCAEVAGSTPVTGTIVRVRYIR